MVRTRPKFTPSRLTTLNAVGLTREKLYNVFSIGYWNSAMEADHSNGS